MLIGERGVVVPPANPMVVLAQATRRAGFFARLSDDVLWDVFEAFSAHQHTQSDAWELDAVRAELHRRHAPVEPDPLCVRCLCSIEDHDDFDMRCPDDERFRAAA